jgi:UDP-N-acetylglucosamine 3-dehydrogenase
MLVVGTRIRLAKIGVIGTGGWGKNHLRVLDELGALGAFADIDILRREQFSKKYGVKGYESFEEMITKEKVDGVTICTPASTHFAIASRVLDLGVHAFVEKPMTTTVRDAQTLIDLAEKKRRILTVGFIERFNPAITELKKIIAEGRLGEPILLEFHRENKRGDNILDVGVVKDASVHDIDTARWLFGEEPETVYARVGTVTSKQEDFAAIMLGFGKQKTAFITTNWVTPNRVRTLEAVFTRGVVNVDFVSQVTEVHEEGGATIPKRPVQEPLLLELKEYVSAIAQNRPALVTGRDGMNTTRIAEAVLASSATSSPIFLSKLGPNS